mmetsp:Transcript_4564/g.12265  ORF Transcript_4564/g.12265 Transcript_4564/m.12265 type:complete len:228 (+) Transcript_4564:1573-2256(+)
MRCRWTPPTRGPLSSSVIYTRRRVTSPRLRRHTRTRWRAPALLMAALPPPSSSSSVSATRSRRLVSWRTRGRRLKPGARCARARLRGWAAGSPCCVRVTWTPPRLHSRRLTSRTTPTPGCGGTSAWWRCCQTGLPRRSKPSGARFGAGSPTTSGLCWVRSASCSWSTGGGNTRRVRCGGASSTAAARTCVTRSAARCTSKGTRRRRGTRCSRRLTRRLKRATPRRRG